MKHTQCAVKSPNLLNQVLPFTSICTSIYLIYAKLPMVGFTIKMSKQTKTKHLLTTQMYFFNDKTTENNKKSNIVIHTPKNSVYIYKTFQL